MREARTRRMFFCAWPERDIAGLFLAEIFLLK
jgi:hypothetical protein